MTTLARYVGTAFALSGSNVVLAPNAVVTVRREDTGALASLFSDRSGAVGISNPTSADAYGRFGFHCAATTDGLRITVTEAASPGLEYTLRYQQCGTMGELDFTDADSFLQTLLADLVADGDVEAYPDANDYLFLGDVSVGAARAMLAQNIFRVLSSMTLISPSPSTARVPVYDGGSPDAVGYFLLSDLPLPRYHISGLQMKNSVASPTETHSIDVTVGSARDSTNVTNLQLTSAITDGVLQSSGAWSAGNFGRKLDTGARANSTTYHCYAIKKDSDLSCDILFSTSASAPTMPSGYTYFRRIGSFKTDSSGNIRRFKQTGDYFMLETVLNEVNGTVSSSASRTLVTLTGIPTGFKMRWIGSVALATDASNGRGLVVTDPDDADVAFGQSTGVTVEGSDQTAAATHGNYAECFTDTSARLGTRGGAGHAYYLNTHGWIDNRGKDA